jgi:hypothetical protein
MGDGQGTRRLDAEIKWRSWCRVANGASTIERGDRESVLHAQKIGGSIQIRSHQACRPEGRIPSVSASSAEKKFSGDQRAIFVHRSGDFRELRPTLAPDRKKA